ncbi:hypothetical protein K461DRAFT_216468, partial [Myriangium duriaei CBS 260.36]
KDEAEETIQQFTQISLEPGKQVRWSGIPREWAQAWANKRGLQTLSTAMGPLMVAEDARCRKRNKSLHEWSTYIKGASASFAECISKGSAVRVLLRPPPGRFHPEGTTTFQSLERPILEGTGELQTGCTLYATHITVVGAEDECYQLWPND